MRGRVSGCGCRAYQRQRVYSQPGRAQTVMSAAARARAAPRDPPLAPSRAARRGVAGVPHTRAQAHAHVRRAALQRGYHVPQCCEALVDCLRLAQRVACDLGLFYALASGLRGPRAGQRQSMGDPHMRHCWRRNRRRSTEWACPSRAPPLPPPPRGACHLRSEPQLAPTANARRPPRSPTPRLRFPPTPPFRPPGRRGAAAWSPGARRSGRAP